MIPPRITGPSQQQPAQIEDAEFVEIGAEPTPTAVKAKRVRIRTVLGYVIVGIALLFILDIVFHSDPGPETGSEFASDGVQAQQMLAEWSRQVTGSVSDTGFAMVDGDGVLGSLCDRGNAKQLLRFGGQKLGDGEAPEIYDWFYLAEPDENTAIAGAFWFDPAVKTLMVRNAAMFDSKGNPRGALPDATVTVAPSGDGTLDYRGVHFHVCQLGRSGH